MTGEEDNPAIPAATVVLVRDGAVGARGAHAAPRVEGRLRRDVGVPRRAGRRRRPPRRRRRAGLGPSGGGAGGARGVRPGRRPRRPGAVLALAAARHHPAPLRDLVLRRSGERRRGGGRRRRDPRARVAGAPARCSTGATGARSTWPRPPGSRCTTSRSTTTSTRRSPRRRPGTRSPTTRPGGAGWRAAPWRCGTATAATRPPTPRWPALAIGSWMLEDGWRLERD